MHKLKFTLQKRLHGEQQAAKDSRRKGMLGFYAAVPLCSVLAANVKRMQINSELRSLNEEAASAKKKWFDSHPGELYASLRGINVDKDFQKRGDEAILNAKTNLKAYWKFAAEAYERHPGLLNDDYHFFARFGSPSELKGIEMRKEWIQNETPGQMADAALLGASLPFLAVLCGVVLSRARSALTRVSNLTTRKPKDSSEVEEYVEDEQLEIPFNLQLVMVDAQPIHQPPEERGRGTAPKAEKTPEVKPERRTPKAHEAQKGIFALDTSAGLAAKGIDPDVFEKALIRAFKILSKNNILMGGNCASTDSVKRDLLRSTGDAAMAERIFSALDSGGLLQRAEGSDEISLIAEPESPFGNMVVRDILARQDEMQKSSRRSAAAS